VSEKRGTEQLLPRANNLLDQEAVENLRAYVLFLEGMDAKYRPARHVRSDRERRARRTVDAAFAAGIDSSTEGC